MIKMKMLAYQIYFEVVQDMVNPATSLTLTRQLEVYLRLAHGLARASLARIP